ncbi:MAG: hypothetical protein ACP5FL_08565 [Thermoplasmatota archaeon]
MSDIEALKAKIEELEKKNAELEQRLQACESNVKKLHEQWHPSR